MSREVALGMLRVGNTGDEILQILDVIVADIESEKTVNEIADILFWVTLMRGHGGWHFAPFLLEWQYAYSAVIVSLCVNGRGA